MSFDLAKLMEKQAESNGDETYAPDPYLDSQCPILSALMSMASYKGVKRQCATLILFCEEGRSKVLVNDKHREKVGVVTIESLEGVFETIEMALRDNKIDWRKAKKGYSR